MKWEACPAVERNPGKITRTRMMSSQSPSGEGATPLTELGAWTGAIQNG